MFAFLHIIRVCQQQNCSDEQCSVCISTCYDRCDVTFGNGTSCLDACGIPNGNGSCAPSPSTSSEYTLTGPGSSTTSSSTSTSTSPSPSSGLLVYVRCSKYLIALITSSESTSS